MKKQTQAERDAILARELDRCAREIALQKRTGKKRSIQWINIDLKTMRVSPPPNALRVVK